MPEHTKMHTGRDENVHVVHNTNVRTRQESRNVEKGEREKERGEYRKRRRRGNEGKQRGKQRRVGKQRKRESENVSGLKTKSEKKRKETDFLY